MDDLAQRLARIEEKLDRVLDRPTIDINEVQHLIDANTLAATYAWLRRHNVKPYDRGKYRRIDIENKIAHLALFGPGRAA